MQRNRQDYERAMEGAFRLGLWIKTLRKSLGLRQRDFADILRVCLNTLCRWETGQALPPAEVLIRLEDECGLERGYTLAILAGEDLHG